MKEAPKRSNEPSVWLLFGAGGTISAIVFPVLVLVVAFLLPLGLLDASHLYSLATSILGKLFLLVAMIFPMWCGVHRVHHGLHDIKVHLPASGVIFYGIATLYTVITIFAVFSM